jgi:WD40 repeat protein/GTPase SAR1 family protein
MSSSRRLQAAPRLRQIRATSETWNAYDRAMTAPPGWTLLHTLRAHRGPIGRLAWSADGTRIATPGEDGLLVIWDAASGKAHRVIRHEASVLCAAFSPDATKIASGSRERPLSSGLATDSTFLEDWSEPLPPEVDELLGDYDVSTEWSVDPDAPEGVAMPLRVFDVDTGMRLADFIGPGVRWPPTSMTWASNGRVLYAGSDDGLAVWQVRTGGLMTLLQGGPVEGLALSPDEQQVALAGRGGWEVWNLETDDVGVSGGREGIDYTDAAWSVRGHLAISADDGVVEVAMPTGPGSVRYLEGHTGRVTAVSFSADGRLLASKSLDGTVWLWDCETWDAVSVLREAARGQSASAGLAFSHRGYGVATLGPAGKVVRLWDLDVPTLMARREVAPTTHYANAKIVLLGDSGVGKTGLGLVLAGRPFEATESSHGRHVWLIDSVEHGGDRPERRETYLWDLAGQPGYRLLHQLHLADVAAALVLFDARSETDPFAGVRHWVRALRQAERATGRSVPKLLVAARTDRGGPGVSDERFQREMGELGFAGYLSTSAKEGRHIEDLFEWITGVIPWDDMPKVSSTGLFDSIKAFLVAERDRSRLLAREDDLLRDYETTRDDQELGGPDAVQPAAEFRTCVDRVANRGLIRRLSFGGYVLLKPEVLDAYAAALVNAARDEPDGTGAISEESARNGRFAIPEDERIGDTDLERLLLAATVEEVLRHEVALREHSDEGPYLVFPTQSRREAPPLQDPDRVWLSVDFEGPVQHVYATLVVRLAHSGYFAREATFREATTFRKKVTILGVSVHETEEGHGTLRLFAQGEPDPQLQGFFSDYVVAHVSRRAVPETVIVDRTLRCGGCGLEVTDQMRKLARARGRTAISCPICDKRIDITPVAEDVNELVVKDMDASADERRDQVAATAALAGKELTGEFDVFLAHHGEDKPSVRRIAQHLRSHGLNPWVDEEQIPPGRWFQDRIQAAIPTMPAAAIVIGSDGLGRWELVEMRAFLQECVERDIPVIPVLLPGATFPDELRFLKQLNWVLFGKTLDEEDAISRLIWGVTGRKPAVAR